MRILLRQVAAYLGVGGLVYTIDYALFALTVLAAPGMLLAANALGRIGGAAAGYFLHGRITFAGDHQHRRAAPRYALLFLANLAASSLLLELAVGWLALPPLLARIGVDVAVIAASFAVSRFWVFARP